MYNIVIVYRFDSLQVCGQVPLKYTTLIEEAEDESKQNILLDKYLKYWFYHGPE